ncbi:MAG: fructosamine kinase family protein [Pirellulaceae bacterium]|nr:fructosamine kinase family protein [Pirellulaceae bacterium]
MGGSAFQIATAACHLLAELAGENVQPVAFRPVEGGCINDAIYLETAQHRYFVKSHADLKAAAMFQAEAEGLRCLSRGSLQVPDVVVHGMVDGGPAMLVLDWIESRTPTVHFSEQLGRGLAELHAQVLSKECGWSSDNFLGTSVQRNERRTDWVEFWRENRLSYQLELAFRNGLIATEWRGRCERFLDRLDEVLGFQNAPYSLLHGDLWSGNYMVGNTGEPTLIDPAVYYGQAEADFGIIALFGGFEQRFFDAYHELRPRQDGFTERVEIYKLYHLLNHLNLFGTSYLAPSLAIIQQFS